MLFERVEAVVVAAIDLVAVADKLLLEVNSSERSITHAIALRLSAQPEFAAWSIDCEYSRHGEVPKRLILPKETCRPDDLVAKTVYPDIVVHKRTTDDSNLLVIEAKKSTGNSEFDRMKIQEYIRVLQYKFGLLLTIPLVGDERFRFEWWDNNLGEPRRLK